MCERLYRTQRDCRLPLPSKLAPRRYELSKPYFRGGLLRLRWEQPRAAGNYNSLNCSPMVAAHTCSVVFRGH